MDININNDEFIIFTAVGDVCFSGNVMSEFDNKGVDPFGNVKHKFIDSDITFCNLESPLTKSEKKQSRHYSKILGGSFRKSDPRFVEVLKDSNFNIVSLANNHILDYTIDGLLDTIDALNNVNISYIGAGNNIFEARKAHLIEKNKIKIAFLAYSYTYEATNKSAGCAPIWKSLIIDDIKKIRNKVDHVIISLHFGEEFSNIPSLFDKKLVHLLVDQGADLIIGHHPHVLREIEYYKNGTIVYSLGNFLFDPSSIVSDEILKNMQKSIIITFKIYKNNIIIDNMCRVHLSDQGIPFISQNSMKSLVYNELSSYSYNIINNEVKRNNVYAQKFFYSLKLIYASLKIGEYKNIYLIFKRYLNSI